MKSNQKVVWDLTEVEHSDVSEMMRFPFAHDMGPIPDYVKFEFNKLRGGPEGGSHYKLLNYLSSKVYNNEIIIEIGTRAGFSAMALAISKRNQIITYDIAPHIIHYAQHLIKNLGYHNIMYKELDMNKEYDYVFNFTRCIFLDVDPHDGIQEKVFFEKLDALGYKGIVILDDTYWEQMKDFMSSIKHKIYDVSKFAHGTGTHVVDFSDGENFEIIGLETV